MTRRPSGLAAHAVAFSFFWQRNSVAFGCVGPILSEATVSPSVLFELASQLTMPRDGKPFSALTLVAAALSRSVAS